MNSDSVVNCGKLLFTLLKLKLKRSNILKIRKYIILYLTLTFNSTNLYSQKDKIEFEHLSSEQGLSVNSIFSIAQDNKGFIWIATVDGLNRYDGYEFKIFRNDPTDASSLSNNQVTFVYCDVYGNLWAGTWGGGLNLYDQEKEKFVRFMHDPEDSGSLSSNLIWSIFQDKSGVLWIGTEDGLNKFDYKAKQFKKYFHDPNNPKSISSSNVMSFAEDNSGVLWVGTVHGGLNRFDKEKEEFKSFNYDPANSKSLSHSIIRGICVDKTGIIWVATPGGGLNRFDKEKDEFTVYNNNPKDPSSISGNSIIIVYEDRSGILWAGARGLNKFIKETNIFTRYLSSLNDPTSLSDNSVSTIFEDRSGVIWIGGWSGALNKFVNQKQQFTKYRYNPDDPNSLSGKEVSAIYEDKSGVLWVGSIGLNKLVKNTGTFLKYLHNPNDHTSISNNYVSSFLEDKSGVLWIGGIGLNKFDRQKGKFTRYSATDNPKGLNGWFVTSIYEDKLGTIWVGTDVGLNKFDKIKEEFIHYEPDPDDSSSLSASQVKTIYEDKSGVLWIGTLVGLNKFDKERKHFTRYFHNPNDPTSLSNDAVYNIYEDKAGNFWIGTLGGGLNKFDRRTGKFIHYREKDGLPNDVINGILEDDHGYLWISTNKGLSKFNPKKETFRNYDISDGLQSNEFLANSYFKNKKGEMFFGGINGFNVFHPDSIKNNSHIPPVVITNFLLFNKSAPVGFDASYGRTILEKSITVTKELILTHEDYIFSFEFAALDFHSPEKNKYAYLMEGFDKDWNFTDSKRRFAVYTNLDPGEYIFRVKGSNNDGVWNEKGTAIKIIITPPWWATWWAYSLYGLFALSLLFSLRRYELNRTGYKHNLELKKVEAEKLLEADKMKSRFFANISHEFRTPLTLILGPIEKIIFRHKDNETFKEAGIIKRNATQLLGLVNQLLDLSKLEEGKLKLQASKGNIVSFVKGITMSFESIAERKNIKLIFSSAKEEIDLYFDKDKMTKILTNLLSNAFKFTPEGGSVTVSINLPTPKSPPVEGTFKSVLSPPLEGRGVGQNSDNEYIFISVRDTGIGIPKEELPKMFDRFYQVDASQTREYEGTGIGLALTKELMELHHGKIKVQSQLGEGTEFTIELPAGREYLSDSEILDIPQVEIIPDTISPLVEKEFINVDKIKSLFMNQTDHHEFSDEKNIILIVEDNADVREFIKDSLVNNFHIEEAVNGEQGVLKAEQIIPDLIICDIMMPKMSGNELTRILKNDEKTSHIPIILLTAKSEQESKLEGLQIGADDYLTKPFDSNELMLRIKNLITIRRKLHEKFSKGDFAYKRDKKKLSILDEQFISKVMDVIDRHISEEEFSIEAFDKEIGMGRVQIYRKLKALTGKSPSKFIRSKRLFAARQMILGKKGNISEIAYSVGFGSPTYFTKCFKEEFGHLPSDLLK